MFTPMRSHSEAARIASLAFLLAFSLATAALRGQVVDPGKQKPKQPDIGAIASMKHDVQPFGKTNDGQEVKVHTLTNLNGIRVRLIDYGATLISVETPDRS